MLSSAIQTFTLLSVTHRQNLADEAMQAKPASQNQDRTRLLSISIL